MALATLHTISLSWALDQTANGETMNYYVKFGFVRNANYIRAAI